MSGRLVLGLTGAVIGAYFGNPALGWTLGTLVGSLAFPPEGQHTDSRNLEPRLQDSVVTSGVNGSPRQQFWGTIRQAGEIIWTAPLEIEEVTTTSNSGGGGGKGGGGGNSNTQTSTTYNYFRSFAVGFGTGPADNVVQMFFDGNIALDRKGTEDDVIKEGLVYRFYKGNDEQLPDPLVVNLQGVTRAPAFRGTPYIMFDRLPVKDYGGRVPNITAVLTKEASPTRLVNLATSLTSSMFSTIDTGSIAVDWIRSRAYLYSPTAPTGFRRYDIRTMTETYQITTDDAINTVVLEPVPTISSYMYCPPDGSLILNIGTSNSRPIVRLNPDTLKETNRFGVESSFLGMDLTRFETVYQFWSVTCIGLTGMLTGICCGSFFSSVGVLGALPDLEWRTDTDSSGKGAQMASDGVFKSGCGGPILEGEGRAYYLMGPTYGIPSSNPLVLYVIVARPTPNPAAAFGGPLETIGVGIERIRVFTPGELIEGATSLSTAGKGLMYDAVDDTIIFGVSDEPGVRSFLVKYDPNEDIFIWKTQTKFQWNDPRTGDSRLVNSSLGWIGAAGYGIFLNTATGEVYENFIEPPWPQQPSIGALGYYDSRNESFLTTTSTPGALARFYFNRLSGAGTNLASIVTDICIRKGIPESRIDVLDIIDIEVPGYLLARQVTGIQALAPLFQFYQIDVIESDFKVRFMKRGKPVVDILTLEDYKYNEENTLVPSVRVKDTDLPSQYNITYLDPNQDYNQDTRHAKRIRNPTPAMQSDNPLGFTVSAALAPSIVKQQAEKLLFSEWNQKDAYDITTHWGKLKLTSGDSVTLQLSPGNYTQARIVQNGLGTDLSYKLNLVGEHPAQYDSTATAVSGIGFIVPKVSSTNMVRLFLIDSPLLRDTDEPPSRAYSIIYYGMSSYEDGKFTRGILYRSGEGSTFEETGTTVTPVKWGVTTSSLADPVQIFATDEDSTLTVLMSVGAGDMASITQETMLNTSQNAAILIKDSGEVEILQYRDVALNADGSFTLHGFIRGQRGTDTMAYGHGSNELFLLLSSASGSKTPIALGDLGTARFYKGVGVNQKFDDAPTETITPIGRALMPWAPVHQKAVLGVGDTITLTWDRRTRVGGSIRDGVATVPLSEDTEAYDVEILSSPGGSIARTYTGLVNPTAIYSSTDQVADGFSPPLTEITFIVYQKSVQVGRGFGREVTLLL
jgi:Putative phage tail protein